jgi:Flp pilus assembly protein TadD
MELHRTQDATEFVNAWLKKSPDDHGIRLFLAYQLARSGNTQAAITQYEYINTKKPGQPGILNDLAWLYQGNGDGKQAMDLAEKAYKLDPKNPNILDTLGWIELQRGQTKRAVELISQAAGIAPERPDIRFHYAKALLKGGNSIKARSELQALLALPMDTPLKAEARSLLTTMK